MSARLYKCIRCGYHYAPKKMERYVAVGRRDSSAYVCRDTARCSRNITQRESDREALKR